MSKSFKKGMKFGSVEVTHVLYGNVWLKSTLPDGCEIPCAIYTDRFGYEYTELNPPMLMLLGIIGDTVEVRPPTRDEEFMCLLKRDPTNRYALWSYYAEKRSGEADG